MKDNTMTTNEDPKLKRTRVSIAYTSTDGYRMEYDARGGTGTRHRVTGQEVLPEKALLGALEELARITALFGFEDQALEVFTTARERIAKFKQSKATKGA